MKIERLGCNGGIKVGEFKGWLNVEAPLYKAFQIE